MATEVKSLLTNWINSSKHKDLLKLGEINEQQYSIEILGINDNTLFFIFCDEGWKPMFVRAEQKFSEWCLSINRYMQMFTNGAEMKKLLEEIEKTFSNVLNQVNCLGYHISSIL
jgi:hypothetical protein